MDIKNKNMARNEKAEFAVKILIEYAKENGINGRDTTDLSPLEQWLIVRLYNVVGQSGQLVCQCSTNNIRGVVNGVAYCEDCEQPKAS